MTLYMLSQQRTEEWQPAADIYRTRSGWLLKFDLAGVRMEDVQVHVSRRSVSVSGVRRDWMVEDAGCLHYSMEISYSRFQRTIELPDEIHAARTAVEYRDGILTVRIAQQEESE